MKVEKFTSLISALAVTATVFTPFSASHAETAQTLSVGADKTYKTISEAVAKAKEINPQSEEGRITINIDPGNYEEQVIIDNTKYVTLQQTPGTDGRVDLNWYYCTGYCASNADLEIILQHHAVTGHQIGIR